MALPAESEDAFRRGGKAVVDGLLKFRRTMAGSQLGFMSDINTAIESIRQKTKLSEHQREELILYAIERSGCVTLKEISEDCRLPEEMVKTIIVDLGAQGILYKVRRYCPGSDRPQYAIKSRRVKTPEAE